MFCFRCSVKTSLWLRQHVEVICKREASTDLFETTSLHEVETRHSLSVRKKEVVSPHQRDPFNIYLPGHVNYGVIFDYLNVIFWRIVMCFISLESVQPKLKRCASQKIVIIDKIWKSLSYCQLFKLCECFNIFEICLFLWAESKDVLIVSFSSPLCFDWYFYLLWRHF